MHDPKRLLAGISVALLSLAAASCGPVEEPSETCAQLAASNEGCWNTDLDTRCEELAAECPGNILVAESCPVQLSCA